MAIVATVVAFVLGGTALVVLGVMAVAHNFFHSVLQGEDLPEAQRQKLERDLSAVPGVTGAVVTFRPYGLDIGPAELHLQLTSTTSTDRTQLLAVLKAAMPVMCRNVPQALDPLTENSPPDLQVSVTNAPNGTVPNRTTAPTTTSAPGAEPPTSSGAPGSSPAEVTLIDLGFREYPTVSDLRSYCTTGVAPTRTPPALP